MAFLEYRSCITSENSVIANHIYLGVLGFLVQDTVGTDLVEGTEY